MQRTDELVTNTSKHGNTRFGILIRQYLGSVGGKHSPIAD